MNLTKQIAYAFPFVLAFLATGCQPKSSGEDSLAPVLSEDQKAIYAFGVATGQQVAQQTKQLRLSPEELRAFQTGFSDSLTGKQPAVEISEYEERFQALAQARLEAREVEAQKQGADVLADAMQEKGAIKTDSGLIYKMLKPGKGKHPQATDTVRVHYHGTLPDGKVFDSSVERKTPAEFSLTQVIPCWEEGLQRMQVGEKAKLVCPPSLAYGDRGAGGEIPPGATLLFEVELLDIVNK